MNPPAPDQPNLRPNAPVSPVQPDLFEPSVDSGLAPSVAPPPSPAPAPPESSAPAPATEPLTPSVRPEFPGLADTDHPPTDPAEVTDDREEVEANADFDDFEGSDLADWKQSLRTAFETWLARIQDLPDPDEVDPAAAEPPDLYSFYQQLAAANAENRKANRRTAEAISQWGEILARFENSLAPLRETTEALTAAQPGEAQLSRSHCQVLVELLDRMQRIAQAFDAPPPKKTWWGGADAAWRKRWETQSQAFAILVSHLEGLLEAEGVTRIPALGQLFDPTVMAAVATETDAHRPAQTVTEEIAAGYRLHGELLRPAQVKVSRLP